MDTQTVRTVRPIIVDAVGDFVSVRDLMVFHNDPGPWVRIIRYLDQTTGEHYLLEATVTPIPHHKQRDYVRAMMGWVEGTQDDVRLYHHRGNRWADQTKNICDDTACWCWGTHELRP